jgi:hypothetical protein
MGGTERRVRRSVVVGLVCLGALAVGCGDDGNGGGGGGGGGVSGTWSSVASGAMQGLIGVWGTGADNVYAIGSTVIRRFNGTAWGNGPDLELMVEGMNGPMVAFNLTAIGGAEAGSFFTAGVTQPEDGSADVGVNRILRVQGTRHSALEPAQAVTMRGIFGRAPNDVWAVGGDMALHWNGTTWQRRATGIQPGSDLYAVWAAAADNVYAVGQRVYRWDGSMWAPIELPGTAYYFGVSGTGPNDVWIVGNSAARHWNGTEWQRVLTGTTEPLNAVWAVASNDVWAVGNGGTIVHWDGTAFSTVRSNTTSTLRALWGSGANNLWAVGDNGVALRYR